MRLRQIGLKREGVSITRRRLVELALALEGVAEMQMRGGIIGPQRDRAPMRGDRLVEPTLLLEQRAEIVVALGIIRSRGDRPAEQRFGLR